VELYLNAATTHRKRERKNHILYKFTMQMICCYTTFSFNNFNLLSKCPWNIYGTGAVCTRADLNVEKISLASMNVH
jgi:hypothetical protein